MKEANIHTQIEFNENKPLMTILFETHFTKEIRIAMQKGTTMKEHRTKFPIVVELVKGAIDFGVMGEVKNLTQGDLIALQGGIPHDLKATEDSIVRLTLTKYDNTERVEKVVA